MFDRSHRLFVGNLPPEVTRDDIVKKFKEHGSVESVEIKSKKDPVSGEISSTFCFLNLVTDDNSLNNCTLLLNGIKWGERHIKVDVAKESFIQRLQRERQEKQPPSITNSVPTQQRASRLSPQKGMENNVRNAGPFQQSTNRSSPQKGIETNFRNLGQDKDMVNKRPTPKKVYNSSDSSDSEDEAEVCHPTSKLLKFKGISSYLSNMSESVLEPPPKNWENSKLSNKEIILNEEKIIPASKFPTKAPAQPRHSNDILSRFEMFSDVWKDEDESSSGTGFQNFRQNGNGRNERTFQKASVETDIKRNDAHEFSTSFSSSSNAFVGSQNRSFPNEGERNVPNEPKPIGSLSASAAEERRLKSIEERRQAFEQQKKAIQQALSGKNGPQVNKKIRFSENESDEEPLSTANISSRGFRENANSNTQRNRNKALTLFDDGDEAENDDFSGNFQLKKQFEGEKGKKLLELQGRFNNDQRFKLDERFYDGDEEPRSKNHFSRDSEQQKADELLEDLAEEREQQLQILSSIVGKPISTVQPLAQKESKAMGMLRYDPLKPNHRKYELLREPKEKKKKRKSKPNSYEEKEEEEEEEDNIEEEVGRPSVRREEKEPEPVSQSKFYSVSDTLAETLKLAKEGKGSGFSLLQMFGSAGGPPEQMEKQNSYPGVTSSRLLKRAVPFHDSSSEDEGSETEGPTAGATLQLENNKSHGIISTGGVWQESFFLLPNDNRLSEGNDFFSNLGALTADDRSRFAEKRTNLKREAKFKKKKATQEANILRLGRNGRKKETSWLKTNKGAQRPRPRR